MAEGLLLILSGPSGVGKGTVCRALLAQLPRLKLSVSVTTRRSPSWEEEGRKYHFISPSRFQELTEAEAFLEWAMVHGQYYTLNLKCAPFPAGGFDPPAGNRRPGAAQVKRQWDDAVTIFMAPPSMDALKERIAGRGPKARRRSRRLDACSGNGCIPCL